MCYLIDTYGIEKMGDLVHALCEGASTDEALMDVYGFDTDGLETEWQASLREIEASG